MILPHTELGSLAVSNAPRRLVGCTPCLLVRRRAWLLSFFTFWFGVSSSFGQRGEGGPAETSDAAAMADDLSHGKRLLEGVRDNVFSFDDPAFYWFRNYVRNDDVAARYEVSDGEEAIPWRFLLERPGDYRGELVVIEGRLLAKYEYDVPNRPGEGPWFQCELGERGTRAICTAIVIENPDAIPMRGHVRAKGFFLKVRAFKTNSGEDGAGPLIVARSLELLNRPSTGAIDAAFESGDGLIWLAAGIAVLAAFWFILRRGLRLSPGPETGRLPGTHIRPESEDDFDWLTKPENSKETDNE